MQNFPYESYASGWYQIGYSEQIEVGASVALRYFERDFACYRDREGALHLIDAFCPHMGAHLGYGATVEDGGIRCPFHGWKWGFDGRNIDIPYSPPSSMRLRLRQHEVREVNGVILMWFDAEGGEPTWSPAPLIWAEDESDADYWPIHTDTSHTWHGVRFPPQLVTENSCDAAHFRYVHQASQVPELTSFGAQEHRFRTDISMRFGGGKESTWATPNGPLLGTIINVCYGVGYTSSEFTSFDRVYTLASTTPVDSQTSDHFATVWVPRRRGDGSPMTEELRDRWARQQITQHAADFPVWENMNYVARPPFARNEALAFKALRAWCRQFYPEQKAVAGASMR